jgi:primosomal protein N' (replication factor Y) (superfamily II helicase)
METDKKIILDIVPLTRVSLRNRQFFSYLPPTTFAQDLNSKNPNVKNEKPDSNVVGGKSDSEVPIGSLVSIPFSNRSIEGVVINSRLNNLQSKPASPVGGFKLKKIGKIISENFVTENQLRLANFASSYYLSPLGITLKSFIPKIIKARNKKQETKDKINKKFVKLTAEQQFAFKKILNTKYKIQNTKYLLYGPPSSGKTEIFLQATKKLKKGEQALILLPELLIANQTIERLKNYFSVSEIAILHSKISKGEFFQNWEKTRSGKAKIIIGTRMAVFAPFKNLKLIGVEEEQDVSHKQWDMNPRYDSRTLAEKLSEICKAKLVFISATPRVETFFRTQNKEMELLQIPALGKSETETAIIDLRKEKAVFKNKSLISKELEKEIFWNLKFGNQIILFSNRRGMSQFSYCVECKTILKCPKCDRALVYDEDGFYRCFQCSFKTDAFPKCQKCQNIVFKNFGQGNQAVEREVQKMFPSAKIRKVDFESMSAKGSYEKLIQDFTDKKIEILIGTQLSNKGWDLPGVGLVGIINVDELFQFPDFNQDEKAFQFIVQASGRTGRFGRKFKSKVLIQTYDPENFIVKTAAANDFPKFFEKEIEERKALNFPPFSRIIKLIFQDAKFEKAEKETKIAFDNISRISKDNNFKVQENLDPMVPKVRGRFRKNIIIKLKTKEIPPELKKYLEKLGSGWIIDIDPISII